MKQPNAWSCFPTCVSILTDIPFDTIIKTIGHDGSKIIHPEETTAKRYEGFDLSEMSIALLKLGWASTRFAAAIEHEHTKQKLTNYPDLPEMGNLLAELNLSTIIGVRKPDTIHCLAWKPGKNIIIDPLIGEEQKAVLCCPLQIIEFIVLTKIMRRII